MGEYERLQAQKIKIVAAEKAKDARSVIARLVPYLHHDYLCACRDVKDGGCTCGLSSLIDELADVPGLGSSVGSEVVVISGHNKGTR